MPTKIKSLLLFCDSVRKRQKIALLIAFMCLSVPFVSQAASVEDYLKEAQEYAKKGDVNAAIIQLKNALQKDPKSIKARFFLGENYLKRGDGASAEKELSRAQRLGMARQQMVVPLGRAMLLQGHAEDVLEKIKIKKDFPVDIRSDIYVLQANAQMMLKDNKAAGVLFTKAIALSPESLNALAGQTRLAIVKRDIPAAKETSEKLIKLHPESDTAWAAHGEVARLSGDMKTAQKSFDKAVSLQSYNLSALLGSANVKLALGNTKGAAQRIATIQTISPNHPMANYLNAILLYRKKDITGAEVSLQKVLKIAPSHIPSLQLMGAIDFSKGRYEQADLALSRVVQAYPKNRAAVKLLATIRLKLNQPAEAIKLLESILVSAPKDAQILALLGSAYMQNKQITKGTEYLEKAVAASPNAARIRTQLALGRLAAGNTSQAVKELESAVELGQNVLQADVLLIMVQLREKAYAKALKQTQKFAIKMPNNPLPYNLMGAAYIGLEKKKLAREKFNLALTKDANFLPAAMNLARLDEQEKNTEGARKRYKAILSKQKNHLGALLSLARLADMAGKGEEAVMLLEKAWESNEGAIQPGMLLIRYYNRKQQPLRAVSIARDLTVKHPSNPTIMNALGVSQMVAKDYHSALATFKSLAKLLPESPQPYRAMARANKQLGDANAQKKNLKKAISLREDFLPAQLSLAQLELKAKRPKIAMSVAKTIQKQRPNEAAGFRLQGNAHMAQNQYSSAVKSYQQAYRKSPTAPLAIAIYQARKKANIKKPYASLEAWLEKNTDDRMVGSILAGAYQENGMLEKAVEQYQQVIKNHPKDVAALNNLAWSLHELGRADALGYAQRAYDLASDNPAVIDTFAWLLVQNGKIDRGVVLLQQAVVQAPHIAEIRYHLGAGLYKAGRRAEAKSELKRVLEISPDFSEAKAVRDLLAELGS